MADLGQKRQVVLSPGGEEGVQRVDTSDPPNCAFWSFGAHTVRRSRSPKISLEIASLD